MAKRVLSVGQCGPDHAAICRFLTRQFACEVVPSDGLDDTVDYLKLEPFDLVLVNRKLDKDYSDGIDIIRALKSDPATSEVPVMLITNYREHQEVAIAAGALSGFGKLEFDKPETRDRIAAVLGEPVKERLVKE